MKITLVLDVPKIKSHTIGQDYAACLAEHIVETFNDDNSIKSVWTAVPKPQEGHS